MSSADGELTTDMGFDVALPCYHDNEGNDVKLDDIDHWMTQITEMQASTAVKLDRLTDHVDKLAVLSIQTEQKIDRLADKIDRQTTNIDKLGEKIDRQTTNIDKLGEKIDRQTTNIDKLGEKIDALVGASAVTNANINKLVEALLRRERE